MEQQHVKLLNELLDKTIAHNRSLNPGSPMANLHQAIEQAIENLPRLQFDTFEQAIEDKSSAEQLIQRAPQMIGWDAENLIAWIEELAKKT